MLKAESSFSTLEIRNVLREGVFVSVLNTCNDCRVLGEARRVTCDQSNPRDQCFVASREKTQADGPGVAGTSDT